jgi:antitoxin CptB
MNKNLDKARILWCCRRGMLELDLLLGRFMEQAFDKLDESRKQTFRKILEESDPDLYAWLMGYEKPQSEEFLEFVNWFRTHHCHVKP